MNQFALSIQKSKSIRCDPSTFKIYLEDNLLNSAMVTAGNPVVIRIRTHDLAEALTKQGQKLTDFKRIMEHCLLVVPRMLHTLSLVPMSQVIKWDEEVKLFRKHKGEETELLPRLLPDKDIRYDIKLYIRAIHIPSDNYIVVMDKNLNAEPLLRRARQTLSDQVLGEPEED